MTLVITAAKYIRASDFLVEIFSQIPQMAFPLGKKRTVWPSGGQPYTVNVIFILSIVPWFSRFNAVIMQEV